MAVDEIRAVRRKLDDAGIDVFAYNIPVNALQQTGHPARFGRALREGTNPIREVLQTMKKEKMTFVVILERTYNLPEGADNVAELRKCMEYCRAAT